MLLCHLPLSFSMAIISVCHTFTKETGNLKFSWIILIHLKFLLLGGASESEGGGVGGEKGVNSNLRGDLDIFFPEGT